MTTNRYTMQTMTTYTDKAIIYHDDYMYPIFKAINKEYVENWHENNCDTWNRRVGKLYKLTIIGPCSWIDLEYPDGLEINMAEDGYIENTRHGQKLYLQIPKDWTLIKISIDNKEIELRKKDKE